MIMSSSLSSSGCFVGERASDPSHRNNSNASATFNREWGYPDTCARPRYDTGSLTFGCLRWSQAKRFHEQLSNLAESDENIRLLTRLNARIQEGIDAQVGRVVLCF